MAFLSNFAELSMFFSRFLSKLENDPLIINYRFWQKVY